MLTNSKDHAKYSVDQLIKLKHCQIENLVGLIEFNGDTWKLNNYHELIKEKLAVIADKCEVRLTILLKFSQKLDYKDILMLKLIAFHELAKSRFSQSKEFVITDISDCSINTVDFDFIICVNEDNVNNYSSELDIIKEVLGISISEHYCLIDDYSDIGIYHKISILKLKCANPSSYIKLIIDDSGSEGSAFDCSHLYKLEKLKNLVSELAVNDVFIEIFDSKNKNLELEKSLNFTVYPNFIPRLEIEYGRLNVNFLSGLAKATESELINTYSHFCKVFLKIYPTSSSSTINDLFYMIKKQYNQGWRKYHTMTHINDLLNQFDRIYKVESHRLDYVVTTISILFHDIVFVTSRYDNEIRSAEFCKNFLNKNFKLEKDENYEILLERSQEFIMATKNHFNRNSSDFNLNLFLDLDLSSLSYDYPIDEGQRFVFEYSHDMTLKEVSKARVWYMSSAISNRIYYTKYFESLEKKAKENINALIDYDTKMINEIS